MYPSFTNSSPSPHMEEIHHRNHRRRHLLQPLLPHSPAAASPPSFGLLFRLSFVAFVAVLSLWANHEASKGYAIAVVNESRNTPYGDRFQLFYVANDEATRTAIKASNVIEDFLFPDSRTEKKAIKSVTLKLVGRNLSDDVTVETGDDHGRFVINLSPSVMVGANFRGDVAMAIRRGVARIWLWDGVGSAPKNLIEGVVEYLVSYLDSSSTHLSAREPKSSEPTLACWDSSDPREVAEFLRIEERRRPGFVRRLNYAMKDRWDEERLGGALGLPVVEVCGSLRYNFSSV